MKASLDKKIYFINIFALLSFSLLIFYFLYNSLGEQKKSLILSAENKTASFAKFMSSDIDRFILSVGEIIEGIHNVDELIEEHSNSTDEHTKEVDKILEKSIRPYIRNILILDEKIEAVHWADKNNQEDIKDIKYIYSHFEKSQSKEILLSTPQASHIKDRKRFFSISRGYYINNHLHSVIIAFFDVDFFKNRYKENLDSSFVIASTTGRIYLHHPHTKASMTKYVQKIKQLGQKNIHEEHYSLDSTFFNKEKIATFIKSEYYPIVVGVSILTQKALEPWEEHKKHVYSIGSIISIGFFLLIYYYTKLQNKLIRLTQYDSLTKLFNRGYFTKRAEYEYKRSKRFEDDLSILMIDIDKFKNINDTYGHKEGDVVIQNMTKDILKNIREIDLAGRYGGEEFIVVLPKTNEEGAFMIAKRIKDSIELSNQSVSISTTASFGIASLKQTDTNLDEIITRADQALYVSKNEGRNRITVESQSHN